MADGCFSKAEVVISQPWIDMSMKFCLLIDVDLRKSMTSLNTKPEVVWSHRDRLFSSLRGRQLLSCLALRPQIGPNALPLTNQKPNDKGKGLYPP